MENQEVVNYILLALLLILFLTALIVFSTEYMRRKVIKEKMLNAELKLKHQTDLLHTVIRSQEEERMRVSDALHDDIGSKLTTIKLSLHQLAKRDESELMKGVLELSEMVVDRTRELSHAYSPLIVEKFGLESGIEELLDELESKSSIQTSLEAAINEKCLDKENRLILYRITQELINNTLKHAQAQNLKITIDVDDHQVFYTYEDDGKGFDTDSVSSGLGMLNMQNRVSMMQARFEVESRPGAGMKVTIRKQFQ